ncbi:dienelactone hydrolase family protein [Legionella nagasakiensis]|uniref:dienelactone hydrolase family protein n=1 Tax=Legionella nagasakiensis TaxID=535290 RepID=UPI001055FE79|nr:dienelactone hydrolase family protein [Legionella nagasakiensis]
MHSSNYVYYHGEQELHGYLAYDNQTTKPRPAVLVIHDWTGRNEFACQKAEQLANMGYIGFAIDLYGLGRQGKSIEEKKALMEPLANDRLLLRDRIQAGLDALITMAEADHKRIAVIGFCFGGLCALDLARSGATIVGAVSFHGLLNKPEGLSEHTIKAKVLALHGYDDPMVSSGEVMAFCQEMTAAKVDWQVHMYGHTKHAFTNPQAHDETLGTVYDAKAERRSWQAMTDFLQEIFQ